jgi:hypothetical protein
MVELKKKMRNLYETDSLSLAPFLAMKGLKYVETKKSRVTGKYLFVFEDPKFQGSDFSMEFLKSGERAYKNYWGYFRNELAKAMQSSNCEEPLMKAPVDHMDNDE